MFLLQQGNSLSCATWEKRSSIFCSLQCYKLGHMICLLHGNAIHLVRQRVTLLLEMRVLALKFSTKQDGPTLRSEVTYWLYYFVSPTPAASKVPLFPFISILAMFLIHIQDRIRTRINGHAAAYIRSEQYLHRFDVHHCSDL